MKLVVRVVLMLPLLVFLADPALAVDDPQILATFDGGTISERDLTQYRSALKSLNAKATSTDTPEAVLDDLVLNRLIGLEARAMGLDKNPQTRAKLDEILGMAQLRSRISLDELRPGAAEIADYYAAHKEDFRKPLRLRVAHILVAARDQADEIHKAVINGADFAKLAREHSQDSTSAGSGGDLGWLGEDELPKTLVQIALGLEPGQVSTPVETRFGYHLVKTVAIGPVEYYPLDDTLKRELGEQLLNRKHQAQVEAIKQAAWQRHSVFVNREAIEKFTAIRDTRAQDGAPTPASKVEDQVLATIDQERFTVAELRLVEPIMLSFLGQGLKADQLLGTLEHHVTSRVLASEARARKLHEANLVRTQLNSVLGSAYMDARFPREVLKPTDDEIAAYYEAHKHDYQIPRRVHLAHILLATKEAASAALAALRQGADFAELARAESLDPATAARGGDLGAQSVSQLYRPLADTALRLGPGEEGGPVPSPFGHHIVKLIKPSALEYRPQKSLTAQLRQLVVNQKKARLAAELKQGLWEKYRVTIDRAAFPARFAGEAAHADSSATKTTRPRTPRLQLLSRVYYPPAGFDTDSRHRILVANTGDADLKIDGLRGSCGCLRAGSEGTRRLAPGETGELEFLIDPQQAEQEGRSLLTLTIDTNDLVAQGFRLRINLSRPQGEGPGEKN